uniref:Uncharacterized protein n=1 Tax=Anguilla anguilla TaxID=7936 RepID=A0A0E9PVM4_ANGAN
MVILLSALQKLTKLSQDWDTA